MDWAALRTDLQAGWRTIARDRYLFHEGPAADCAFVIMDGRFELTRKDKRGKSVVIGTAIRGDLLGELAIISQTERRMTAMALEDSDVMRINRPMFKRMMEEYPEVATLLRRRISRNVAEMLRGIGTLAPYFE